MHKTELPSLTEAGFFRSVHDFVTFSGGDHSIQKILIANNGIGATKAIRSIRRWAFETFGDERAIQFVVMATPEDMRANAEYIRLADQLVDVPGGSNNNNYANINLICQIAEQLQVDAVMPMWGHASENPTLPNSLLKLNRRVTFIGPSAEPMQALGDKIGSTIIAQSAGVPTIAWNGDHLMVNYKETGIPQSVYDQANVTTAEDALSCAERIGYPVMIKASEGGGGKGIRKVLRAEDVLPLYRQVQAEIPGSPIFVMKMASRARHLEVQLLADRHGEAIALSGRDCSVQRRHQKIIEEGPPTAAPKDTFRRMELAAVSLAKTVGYCNAGTVEYLYLESTQEFAFLELNPRLQVEHPVTENILRLNLPSCQLMVAMGIPLHRIGDIRKLYGRHPLGQDTIDFEFAERVPYPRHCIAVRVTAENPAAGFQPTSGRISELHFHSAIDVWGYFSVNNSGLIHEFADSQFGHIFAGGVDRESARRAMLVALKELQIRGDIRTTVEYIIKMLQSSDFITNRIDTDWLDGRIANHKELALIENRLYCPETTLIATCGAALQGYRFFLKRDQEFIDLLKVGQVPTRDSLTSTVAIDLIYENVKYRTECVQSGAEHIIVHCNDHRQSISVRTLADGGYLVNVAGKSHVGYVKEESGGSLRLILDGHTCMFTPEYDPTKLTSAVAGKLARLLVADASHVNAGEPFVEIEVMKMYMPLKSLEAGIISFQMSEGATLSPGDVIATMTLDNPDSVVTAELFTGKLSQTVSDAARSDSEAALHVKAKDCQKILDQVLQGFPLSDSDINAALNTLIRILRDPMLPVLQVEASLSVLRGRIDTDLYSKISSFNSEFKVRISDNSPSSPSKAPADHQYPSLQILSALQSANQALPIEKRSAFVAQTSELWSVVEPYLFSTDEITLSILDHFLEAYLAVEQLFDNMSFTDVVNKLRKDHGSDPERVLLLCRAHVNLKAKNVLILRTIEVIKSFSLSAKYCRPEVPSGITIRNELNTRRMKSKLQALARLHESNYTHISFTANLLLIDQLKLTLEKRRHLLDEAIVSALVSGDSIGNSDRVSVMQRFIDSNIVFRDILIPSLRRDADYQIAVIELYLYKIYQKTHHLQNMVSGRFLDEEHGPHPWVLFEFMTKHIEAVIEEGFMSKSISFNDLAAFNRRSQVTPPAAIEGDSTTIGRPIVRGLRNGIFTVVDSLDELESLFPTIVSKIPSSRGCNPVNAVHVVISSVDCSTGDDALSVALSKIISLHIEEFKSRCILRITFFVGRASFSSPDRELMPVLFTFRDRIGFAEDQLFRHIEAPHAFHLELSRLKNFVVTLEDGTQTSSGNVHLYKAVPKAGKGSRRYFVRLLSFTTDAHSRDVESLFVESLDHLSIVLNKEDRTAGMKTASNHVFINVLSPDAVVQPDFYDILLRKLCTKYSDKMIRLGVSTVELKLTCRLSLDNDPMFLRLIASNPTGFVLSIDKYYEADSNGCNVLKSINSGRIGPLDGQDTLTPYDVSEKFEKERAIANESSDTLYVYDWPMLFESAAAKRWESSAVPPPSDIFSCTELVMCDSVTGLVLAADWTAKQAELDGVLLPAVSRAPGLNSVGMVAWHVMLKSPECPYGREFVLISNDITFQAGSFGTREDVLFYKASEYARVRGIPRLFLTANSGARIGMAQSLKSKFHVCFVDDKDPSKGFKYLYLTQDRYKALLDAAKGDASALPVICSEIVGPDGANSVYRIDDIIGEEPDLGVENLMGSGLIAGETARAYDEIFTLTLVVGRTVGIGAYLVRLGQRTIQKTRNAPIILTGYQALNKLMGREIYTTNDQLGGPMIMFPNGVSHLLAETHFDAVMKALEWLSFVPARKGGALPIVVLENDPVDRSIQFAPQKGLTYDPRLLFCGVQVDKDWQSGFFDRDSFVETLCGWAKTVVVGRGRLGGIPMGVIVTENRTAEATKPADPADITSQEKLVQQAGGVWFPDSAYKTAQALRDFNREGLPCIIFANWRGFSGGQRDMFDEVLKFGSMIVDALVAYQHPLFVYIPPFAELRGGAWVVVDSTINSDVMEFYAAEDARGGVLEAAGAASIKFRDRDIVATAHRIDRTLGSLDLDLAAARASADEAKVKDVTKQIQTRERALFGVYQQIAVHFADLHDTPGRMQAKGVIRMKVPWSESRKFFYWRLKRKLKEFEVVNTISGTTLAFGRRKSLISELQQWFSSVVGDPSSWDDDRTMVSWLESHPIELQSYISSSRVRSHVSTIGARLSDLLQSADAEGLQRVDVLKHALLYLSEADRDDIRAALK